MHGQQIRGELASHANTGSGGKRYSTNPGA